MKKFSFILFVILLLCVYYTLNYALPTTKEIKLPEAKTKDSILLVPLDSRPVCSTMPQKLGKIVDLQVVLPPQKFLDNYKQPADKKILFFWLYNNVPLYQKNIISADILLHGSLLQSRQTTATLQEQQDLINFLKKTTSKYTTLDVFSIIPRLLVSDELFPDCWYQYHLMQYSQLTDLVNINNDFYFTEQLLHYQEKIPVDIIIKYQNLFNQSKNFNQKLLLSAQRKNNLEIFIGQDDSSPFGLPHQTASQLKQNIEHENLQDKVFLTYGADEIASLLLARYYLAQNNWHPKIYLKYAYDDIEFLHMPYMAVSTGTALRNQINLLHGQITNDLQQADLIVYVNCGNSSYMPNKKQALELSAFLKGSIPVALIDLSANFDDTEMLLPKLLENNVPLNKLAAYAGWNTFSNSSGTALAQALLFSCKLRQLKQNDNNANIIASLYADNLKFTAERILEDYYYQKKIHPSLRPKLESFGITPTNLSEKDKLETEGEIQKKLSLYAFYLLHDNLGRTPFYIDGQKKYYLRNLLVGSQLPWNRIFEVKLTLHTKIGIKKTE